MSHETFQGIFMLMLCNKCININMPVFIIYYLRLHLNILNYFHILTLFMGICTHASRCCNIYKLLLYNKQSNIDLLSILKEQIN